MFLRIGVDVGGTNTDAVLVDASKAGNSVLKWAKVPTSPDVKAGVEHVLETLLTECIVSTADIKCVTIGTTHLINAVVGRDASKLQKVGVIRLASNHFTRLTPPFVDFPLALRDIIQGHVGFINGGLNIDGTPIGEVSEIEVLEQCKLLKRHGLRSVVVVGTFSPVDTEYHQEQVVRDIIVRELAGVEVVCSADIGRLGILERENAAILNASLLGLGQRFIRSIQGALSCAGLAKTLLFLSCNDGTMISAQEALSMPVKVIASGTSNSMIGASYILDSQNDGAFEPKTHGDQGDALIVIDIGGSTTDAGVLLATGYPREASAYSEIAKLKVNFAMPDVQSIGLGGGSVVKWEYRDGQRHATSIGPESVGLELTKKAFCYGGNILTTTDIIIAAGDSPNFGSTSVVVEDSLIISAKEIIRHKLEELVDEIKTKATPLPVAIVGGGSILLQSSLRGTSNILRNPLAPVANAVGAAVAKISSTIDVISHTDNGRSPSQDRKIIKINVEKAIHDCVKRGALRESISIITQDLLSLSYVSNKIRIVVQAVGDLDPNATVSNEGIINAENFEATSSLPPNISADVDKSNRAASFAKLVKQVSAPDGAINVELYRPRVTHKEWYLSETDLEWISIGCYILGCAGGGTPYSVYLEARELLRIGETIKIIDIADITPKAILLPVAKMGSPMVTSERPGGPLLDDAIRIMMESQTLECFSALVCIEVGGSNGIRPLTLGSSAVYNVPMLDGDFMGRAYPTFEKMTPYVLGSGDINDLLPVSLASGDGTNLIMKTSKNTEMVDKALRAACVEMGCAAGVVFRPMTKDEVATTAIMHTHSLAWRLGRAVKKFQLEQSEVSVCDALIAELGGNEAAKTIFEGKIIAVDNRLIKGHSYGSITLAGTSSLPRRSSSTSPADNSTEDAFSASQEHLTITFKNENLLATLSQPSEPSKNPQRLHTLASVPDLIMVLDSRSGHALGVPEYRYGLKTIVLVAAAHPFWTTPRGLEVGGPKAFGLEDVEYTPIGRYVEPKSVIEEYS